MIYTDKVHLVADTLKELHEFAESIGLKRCWFHGLRKNHPHYDLHGDFSDIVIKNGAIVISSKEILIKSKSSCK